MIEATTEARVAAVMNAMTNHALFPFGKPGLLSRFSPFLLRLLEDPVAPLLYLSPFHRKHKFPVA
jgi:hypothetical protein